MKSNLHFQPLFASLAIALLSASTGFAQEVGEVPPPKFPIPLRAAENASWTIEVKPDRSTSSDVDTAKETRKCTVTKTGPIYFEQSQGGNANFEKWVFLMQGNTFRLIKKSDSWERLYPDYYGDISRYETSDFEDAEWINQENYKGVVMSDGKPYYLFEATSTQPLSRRDLRYHDVGDAITNGAPSQTFTYKAWLDPTTLLPAKIQDNREVRTYAYNEPPSTRLTPPTPVLGELQKWVAEINRMNR